ncbi:MAG: hypothetical protein RLZZ387_5057 [Chloroflexota bacterium]
MAKKHSIERDHTTPHTAQSSAGGALSAQHPIMRLQQQVGNAVVSRMLAQRAAAEAGVIGPQGGAVSADLAGRIEAQRGGGTPLPEATRGSMEQSLGADFSDVRVHSGMESEQLNRSMSARAFTTGSDIFLGPGSSASDTGLMAHELTHVVQQRSKPAGGPMTVGPAGDSYEQQADAAAATVAQRRTDGRTG